MSFHIPHYPWSLVVNEERGWVYKAPSSYIVTCRLISFVIYNLLEYFYFSYLSCVSPLSSYNRHITHIYNLFCYKESPRFFTVIFVTVAKVSSLSMSWVWAYPLAANWALYRLTELSVLYFILYTHLHLICLQCWGGSTKSYVLLASSAHISSSMTDRHLASCDPSPHSSLAHELLPLSSCTHSDAPCIHCIHAGSPGSCGVKIDVTSHLPISGPS